MNDETPDTPDPQDGPTINEFRDLGPVSWLEPFRTPHSNLVMHAPPGAEDVKDLDVEIAVEGRSVWTTSAWGLTDKQRQMIAAGAHLSMGVAIHPIPPLCLMVEPPFCSRCQTMQVFVGEVSAFACPNCDPRLSGQSNGGVRLIGEHGGHAPEDDRDASRRALDEAHRDFIPESRGGDAQGDG